MRLATENRHAVKIFHLKSKKATLKFETKNREIEMQALELIAHINDKGFLVLDKPIKSLRNKKVKIIVLSAETEEIEEKEWLYSISNNPSFDFLKEPSEDIYLISDGKPLNVQI